MAAAVARSMSRHGAVAASVLFHGAVLALLILKLTPPILSAPAKAEIPAIAVEVITLPAPAPPPPPPPEPVVIDEPPPLIESTVAETVIEPPPPPKVEERKPEPKPKPKPKPVKTPPKPVEQPPERVETAAAEMPAPAPAAQQTAAVATVGRAGPPPNYSSLLSAALERHKQYPREARQRRQQGRAVLCFTIDRAGNLLASRIEKSSGYDALDREVLAMVKRASPFPPMPADMVVDKFEFTVPVPFTLH